MLLSTILRQPEELEQIKDLQVKNNRQHISEEEFRTQGFITMPFTIDMLQAMNDLAPAIIIKDEDKVVAYALVLLKEGRQIYPPFESMFRNFEKIIWKNKLLTSYNYYVMGQICVAKEYRGQGLVDMLYKKHKEIYSGKYDVVVTEISTSNPRSIKAHENSGFQIINIHKDELDEWAVVLWDWN